MIGIFVFVACVALVNAPKGALTSEQQDRRAQLLSLLLGAKDYWKEHFRWEKMLEAELGRSDFLIARDISRVRGALETCLDAARPVLLAKLANLERELEAYSPPVPVQNSTLPTWVGNFPNLGGIETLALEVALDHLLRRIQRGTLLIAKIRRDYQTRGALADARVWNWRNPVFQCAPKGTLAAYYRALGGLTSMAKSLEFAIEASERLDSRLETPDEWTQWGTHGTPGAGGDSQGEDLRRYPERVGVWGKRDMADMANPLPESKVKHSESVSEWLSWRARVDGHNWTGGETAPAL